MLYALQLANAASYDVLDDNNTPVQLRTKVTSQLDNSLKRVNMESMYNKESSPLPSLSKVGKLAFLKTFTKTSKQKGTDKIIQAESQERIT